MKNTIQLILGFVLISLVTACSPNELVKNVADDGTVSDQYYRNKETLAKEGLYQAFTANGVLVEETEYKNNQLDGYRKLYTDDGKLEIIEHYVKDKYEGSYEVFFPNGKKKQIGAYKNDQAHGEWQTFYPNGQLKETVVIVNGEENGPFKEYSEKGILTAEGAYKGTDKDIGTPKEHGELKIYDESTGELVKTMQCSYGVCSTTWKKEGYEEVINTEAELN